MNMPIHPLASLGRWPADVSVWRLDIATAPDDLARMSSLLDKSERQRAARYRMQADRARFVSTRYALRCLLGERIGMHPAALRFDALARGKPALSGSPDLSFNVSHTGGHALLAISSRRSVGVDIERIDPAFDWRAIVDLVCTAQEKLAIDDASPLQQQRCFLRCWTAKEALVKTLGTGIGDDLTRIGVDPLATGEQRASGPIDGEQAGVAALRAHWLEESDEYVGCVAFGEAA